MINKTTLLVDDEPIVLKTLGRELIEEGYNVTTASSGEEAVSKLEQGHYDLVITDLVMQGLNGIQVLKKAKQINSESTVVILTGYGNMTSAVEALHLGADNYLLKPCDIEELLCRISHCLETKKLKQAIKKQAVKLKKTNKELNWEITEHKQTEVKLKQAVTELKRSNLELEQLCCVASHDLQSPLNTIEGHLRLLEQRYKGKLDADADKCIKYAVDGAIRMKALINDLLEYSRVDMTAPLKTTNCNTVLMQVLISLKGAVKKSNAVVVYSSLPTIMANRRQVVQLFQNLIGNAIKFAVKESPRIQISAEQKDDDWIFSVQDNGIGIAPEFHECIFEMFQRLHSRAKYAGTGIGLAICKKVVDNHGGRIWLESELGSGTTFYFTIPTLKKGE